MSSAELNAVVRSLALLANLPGPSAPRTDARPVDYSRWSELVHENQLGPFIGAGLLAASPTELIPGRVKHDLRGAYLRAGMESLYRQAELMRILALLNGVADPILLKGAALVHTLYSEAAERQMSDFDLLFTSRAQLDAARVVLEREGYRDSGEATPADHHHGPPLKNPVAELTFELHLDLTTPALAPPVLEALLRDARRLSTPGLEAVRVLDSAGRLLHHALHALADPIDSPLLRNLFEVAWMAARLDDNRRQCFIGLVERSGVEVQVGRALHLGARLFGSPAILPKPVEGPYEGWCLERLEWCRSFEPNPDWRLSLRRSFAITHLDQLNSGAAVPAIEVGAEFLMRAAKSRVVSLVSANRHPRRIERVAMRFESVGDGMIAYNPASGEVHLLNAVSATVWRATDQSQERQRLEDRVIAKGVPREHARVALDQLIGRGLLRPCE